MCVQSQDVLTQVSVVYMEYPSLENRNFVGEITEF